MERERDLLTVSEAAALLRIGRNLAYQLVAEGEIPSLRLGRLIRIPRSALEHRIGVTDASSLSLISTFDPPVVTTFDPPLARPLTARAGTAPWYQRASVASITSSLAVPASRDRCGESRCR